MPEPDKTNIREIVHPVIQSRLTTLRNKDTGSVDFRRALKEITLLMAGEITKNLSTTPHPVETPLENTTGYKITKPIIIIPILRAALGMADSLQSILSEASIGHIGMYRDEETHLPQSYYAKFPPKIEKATTLVVDPMLATGHSAAAAITQIKNAGATDIQFACIISCPEGIEHLNSEHPDVPITTAVIDRELNANAYIMPGLGDAGDRYFGTV